MLSPLAEIEDCPGDHLAFAPDGRRWAVVDSRRIRLGTGEAIESDVVAPRRVVHLVFASNARRLLACPDVYDLAAGSWSPVTWLNGALVDGFDDLRGADRCVFLHGAFASDGRDLALVTRYQPSRELGATDSYSGPHIRLLVIDSSGALRGQLYAGSSELYAVTFSDQHVIAGAETLTVWDRASLGEVAQLAHSVVVVAVAVAPATGRLAAGDIAGEVSVWDPASGERLAFWHGHDGGTNAVAWHPTGQLVATSGADEAVRIWAPDGTLLHEETVGGGARTLAFDPGGGRLAVVAGEQPNLRFFALEPPT
jgi:WD40 repeat protein